jgi:hypothetical protein
MRFAPILCVCVCVCVFFFNLYFVFNVGFIGFWIGLHIFLFFFIDLYIYFDAL